jgi:hypothetical protein
LKETDTIQAAVRDPVCDHPAANTESDGGETSLHYLLSDRSANACRTWTSA